MIKFTHRIKQITQKDVYIFYKFHPEQDGRYPLGTKFAPKLEAEDFGELCDQLKQEDLEESVQEEPMDADFSYAENEDVDVDMSFNYDGQLMQEDGETRRSRIRRAPMIQIRGDDDFLLAEVDHVGFNMPFNYDQSHGWYHRYFPIVKDMCMENSELFERDPPLGIRKIHPPHIYRIEFPSVVTLSQNDRDFRLRLEPDQLTITGFEGYSMARCTHSVAYGKWYYEVEFLRQEGEVKEYGELIRPAAHVRIGWGQEQEPVEAPTGFTKFGYSWRSLKGTIFHDARGKHYMDNGGFKQGDVLGCLIDLPNRDDLSPGGFLPPSRKNSNLAVFKQRYFFEYIWYRKRDEKNLKPLKGSRIEFFKNGQSCGTAFTDIHTGFYYPTVSLYYNATLRCNFGPDFKYPPPPGVRPMSERAEEIPLEVEQAMSDMLYLVEKEEAINKLVKKVEERYKEASTSDQSFE